ncbi:hypothetical protein BVL52_08885 [Pseudomonas oryzihabitans]|uniref:Uncharacterized protein n=1 Tax=Pseudomonas oryzihabitans TaxID=47885 RepID=A0ABX3IVW7_9PSED|nr:hypothetical protein BVL52_08885 [Pseudomonas psychrotolerans]
MHKLRMMCCAASLLAAAGCVSQPTVQPIPSACPQPPEPPAWTMQEPSNSLQKLDATFSTSEPASSPTKQP